MGAFNILSKWRKTSNVVDEKDNNLPAPTPRDSDPKCRRILTKKLAVTVGVCFLVGVILIGVLAVHTEILRNFVNWEKENEVAKFRDPNPFKSESFEYESDEWEYIIPDRVSDIFKKN